MQRDSLKGTPQEEFVQFCVHSFALYFHHIVNACVSPAFRLVENYSPTSISEKNTTYRKRKLWFDYGLEKKYCTEFQFCNEWVFLDSLCVWKNFMIAL